MKKNTPGTRFGKDTLTNEYIGNEDSRITYRVSQKKHSYKIFGLEIMLFTCSQT